MNDITPGTLLDEINAQVPAADFELEYFPGGMVHVTMELTAEMVEQVRSLAREHKWPEAEAYVTVIASGIGAFEEAGLHVVQEKADRLADDQLELLVRRLRAMEMRYAVMKHHTWEFLKAYQAASLSDGAIRTQLVGLNHLVERLRGENDAFRAENQRLRQLIARQDTAATVLQPAGATPAAPSLAERMRGMLRGK
jgi:hypothetical protein